MTRPGAARTAFGPMVIAACEQWLPDDRRLLDDELAIRFLPAGQRLIVRACRWHRLYRLLMKVTDSKAHGLWASMLCRKRYADDRVSEALDAGIRQFVFLGAGLDTRPYRLVAPAGARTFEIDLPANIAYKEGRLKAVYGRKPENVDLIPVDFEHDDLGAALAAAGFETERPAMFVWEAVTQYLTEEAVRSTLASLGSAAPGSQLIFTYLRRDYLNRVNDYGAARARHDFVTKHRVWRYGLDPGAVAGLLHEYGWTEREQAGATEYLTRYIAPTGRDLPVSEIERFVYATR